MTITLPDDPAISSMDAGDIRLDLACGAYSAGHVSRTIAARMAGLTLQNFDQILLERKISVFSQETLDEDLQALRTIGKE
jgi:predicted HTH domain antitoxin